MKVQEKYGETCTIHQSRPPWSSWVQACHWTATHPPLWLMIHPQSSDKTSRYSYKHKYRYKYKHIHSNNPKVGELVIIFETNFFVRKGEGGGDYIQNPYTFSLSIKTVIGGYQESNAFGLISKEEDHGRLQVGEKATMWSTGCKERQRRPERDHQVAMRALCASFL